MCLSFMYRKGRKEEREKGRENLRVERKEKLGENDTRDKERSLMKERGR